ncbi:MAG: PIN domain-containing protein [Oscillospiraceae bacterium]|nr:PIN domain-containing protein [Oscillospiraceae bacterium]
MSGRAFFDTNIFIYLYADNEHDKQTISREIIDKASECVTSTQILNEINNVMLKKWRMSAETVKSVQKDVRRISELVYVDEDTIDNAIDLCTRYGFSYYDCLMLSSALAEHCQVIFTEDMNDGQIINDTLKIVNPYKER